MFIRVRVDHINASNLPVCYLVGSFAGCYQFNVEPHLTLQLSTQTSFRRSLQGVRAQTDQSPLEQVPSPLLLRVPSTHDGSWNVSWSLHFCLDPADWMCHLQLLLWLLSKHRHQYDFWHQVQKHCKGCTPHVFPCSITVVLSRNWAWFFFFLLFVIIITLEYSPLSLYIFGRGTLGIVAVYVKQHLDVSTGVWADGCDPYYNHAASTFIFPLYTNTVCWLWHSRFWNYGNNDSSSSSAVERVCVLSATLLVWVVDISAQLHWPRWHGSYVLVSKAEGTSRGGSVKGVQGSVET